MMFPNKLVLAFDFSKESQKLLNRLSELKSLGIEEVIITYIVDITKSGTYNPVIKKNRRERLEGVKSKVEEMGFDSVRTDARLGFPAEEITSFAENENAMILVGSHGKGIIKNVFLGSTAYDIIRKAKTPVFIEKVKHSDKIDDITKKVLFPTDFSKDSKRLFSSVYKSKVPIKEMFLLSVIESSGSEKELKEENEKRKVELEKIKNKFLNLDHIKKIDYKVEQGTASQAISKTARSEKVSLICLPNRGKGTIKEMIIGSTAKEVARLSPVPVLLFPRGEDDPTG